jgi:hypothetical protein
MLSKENGDRDIPWWYYLIGVGIVVSAPEAGKSGLAN